MQVTIWTNANAPHAPALEEPWLAQEDPGGGVWWWVEREAKSHVLVERQGPTQPGRWLGSAQVPVPAFYYARRWECATREDKAPEGWGAWVALARAVPALRSAGFGARGEVGPGEEH